MKILKVMHDAKILLVDLEVSIGNKKQNSPILWLEYRGKNIPLNTVHDGRPLLMNEENAINLD